jgi:hypothetical protein
MTVKTFFALCNWLSANTLLKSLRNKAGVSIKEKVVIFLYITAHGALLQEASKRFSYSFRTVLRLVIITY